MKRFLKSLVSKLDVSPSYTHVSAVAYSNNPEVVYRFNNRQATDDVNNVFDGMHWQRGFTYTDKALLLADNDLYKPSNGMRPNVAKVRTFLQSRLVVFLDYMFCFLFFFAVMTCLVFLMLIYGHRIVIDYCLQHLYIFPFIEISLTNVCQVLIVITDGAQTTTKAYTPLATASAGVKSKGIAVYAIGVGKGANEAELREIASSQENVFVSASFKELHSLAGEIRKRLCDCKSS